MNRNNIKKGFFASLIFFASLTAFAQEKGLHLILGGGLGRTNFTYDLDGGSYKDGLGHGGYLGMQYFFNSRWGISLSGEIFAFNTQSKYANQAFLFNGQTDDEGHPYNLTIRLKDWKENQTSNFLEIPLMGVFQHKFGKKSRHGLYAGVGVKAQIPLSNHFERAEGEIRVSGFYPKWKLPLGEEGKSVELPQHGYGTNANRLWEGTQNLKTGVALVGEFGFLIGLSPRVDLTLGASVDYGLTNISNRADNLLGPIDGKTQQDGSYVSEMVYYNGVLNSSHTSHINTMSVRGKIGLRIKIGKLTAQPEELEEDQDEITDNGRNSGVPDTIYVHPVIVYLPASVSSEQTSESNVEKVPVKENKTDTGELPEEVVEELIESIYFDLNKSALNSDAKEVLNRKAALMKKYPQAIISIVGHTCNIGSGEYNEKLSYERAEAAKGYLIKKGINHSRIVLKPEGMKNPTYPNTSEVNRELNRRVDFFISQ